MKLIPSSERFLSEMFFCNILSLSCSINATLLDIKTGFEAVAILLGTSALIASSTYIIVSV